MRTVGVIAEYNPFHHGHALQLEQAKAKSGADHTVVVMSGCFTQRGEAAILPPAVRAAAALRNGADAVILLPACWSLRDAEHFALGGVSILQGLGVDALSFGAEEANVDLLRRAVDLPDNPPELNRYLQQGLSHAEAMQRSWDACDTEAAALMRSPNNLLGVCYLRAMKALKCEMDVYPVARHGSGHGNPNAGAFSSSTAIRDALQNGNWSAVSESVPENTLDLIQVAALNHHLVPAQALDQALLYRLRTMTEAEFAALPGTAEGLHSRLSQAANVTATRSALLDAAKTRRYPYARLSRMASHALLQINDATFAADPLPTHAILLGYRRNASSLLGQLSQGSIPLITRRRNLPKEKLWLQAEERAWNVFALAAELPSDLLYTEKLIQC